MGMALRFATLHISAMREVKTLITFLVAWAPAPTANTTSRSTRGNRTGGLHFGQNRNKGSSAARMGPLENAKLLKSPLCQISPLRTIFAAWPIPQRVHPCRISPLPNLPFTKRPCPISPLQNIKNPRFFTLAGCSKARWSETPKFDFCCSRHLLGFPWCVGAPWSETPNYRFCCSGHLKRSTTPLLLLPPQPYSKSNSQMYWHSNSYSYCPSCCHSFSYDCPLPLHPSSRTRLYSRYPSRDVSYQYLLFSHDMTVPTFQIMFRNG